MYDTLLGADREEEFPGTRVGLLGSALYALVAVGAGLVADRWGIVAALLAIQAMVPVALPLAWSVHTHARRPSALGHSSGGKTA